MKENPENLPLQVKYASSSRHCSNNLWPLIFARRAVHTLVLWLLFYSKSKKSKKKNGPKGIKPDLFMIPPEGRRLLHQALLPSLIHFIYWIRWHNITDSYRFCIIFHIHVDLKPLSVCCYYRISMTNWKFPKNMGIKLTCSCGFKEIINKHAVTTIIKMATSWFDLIFLKKRWFLMEERGRNEGDPFYWERVMENG